MTEKRHAPRTPVSMRVETQDHPVLGFGYAVNVSELGMAVDAEILEGCEVALPEVGATLRLRFKLPGGTQVLTVRAEMLRVDRSQTTPRLALAFEGLGRDEKREISQFIERNSSKQ